MSEIHVSDEKRTVEPPFNYFTQSDYLVTVNNINMPPRKKSKVWQHFSVKSNAMNLNHPLTMLKRHIDAIDPCI